MKKFYAILCLAIAALTQLQAQAPQGFNYQATVRNSAGDLIINTNVYFKFNVIQGSLTAVPIFTETHYVSTDDLGQVNLVIGQGTANTGAFSALDWSLGSYYLGIELDTGNGYVAMGTTQLLSVPYAMYAESSGSSSSGFPTGGTEGQVLSIFNGVPTWTDVSGSTDSENLAEISTVEATDIDFESMISGGNIDDDGGLTIVSKGVVWSEFPNPDISLQTKTDVGGGASNFTSTINGLSEETEYFYRAYATNSLGTSYGNTYNIITDSSQFYDQDGDGYTPSEGDCDDFDSFTYPGAAFNESSTECMTDVDEDGYGDITAINPGTDCDDSNTFINPGATDSSWTIGGADGIDNDCDGEIDEQDLPLELTNLLAGANEGDSKTWVWASDIPLHVGVGPVTDDYGGGEFAWENWWNTIGPNDPEKSCMYTNEFVFTQTVDGMTFEQTVGPAFVPGAYADIIGVTGDICHDETVATTMFGVKNVSFLQSTSFAAQNGLYYNPITGDQAPYYGVSFDISDGGFMGWYVGDVIYDIISITETTMHVRFIQEGGGYAWYARYKSE